VIRVRPPSDAAGRWALDVLVDLARLLPVEDAAADVVELHVAERDASYSDPAQRAGAWGFAVTDGRVDVPRALLRLVVDVAGAAVEQGSDAEDQHRRVPPAANPLVAAERERTPLVQEAAIALREAVRRAAGRRAVHLVAPWPDGHRWAATLTHDLDVVALWPLFSGLRAVELARKRQLGQLARVVGAAATRVARSPVWEAVRDLVALESSPLSATWFILCGTPTVRTFAQGDLTFTPESPAARRIVEAATRAGHEIGLHGSFATFTAEHELAVQRARLERIAGREVRGVRQHFLRMRPGRTHAAMRAAGFRYDATYGFADRNGFRLGVADVVPAWDATEQEGRDDFDLVPLAWMDRALSKYRGIEDPRAWVDDALALTDVVRAVDGLWTGLWHPNLAPALGYPGAPAQWARLVGELVTRGAWVATASDAVEWRRRRRSTVARRVGEDGRAELADGGVPLE
jgi:hypothetical protein